MALGRIALGVGSLAAPGAMARSFGVRSSPELDYMTRVVRRYVAYTPLYRGTELAGVSMLRDLGSSFGVSGTLISLVSGVCGSCPQFLKGSRMQPRLAAGGAAVPGVEYTTVMTRYDQLVVPYTSGFLPGQRNFVLQELCPANLSEHGAVAFDPVAAQITFNALAPRRARPIRC